MQQETLIYIEEQDKTNAGKLAGGFTIEDTLRRAYINALGSELAMKYLAQEEINVSNIYNLHNIYKIREEFDIADIMLPNIHIDVRMVYDDNFIFIPKSHFEYNLTPDIYLVFQMLDNESCVKFLGFFEPKLINKNNKNEKYYFIEKEKLSHPSDLKSYIENFNGNTTESLSEENFESGQKLAMALIDHDITDDDKRKLINMLTKCAALREDLIDFDNFEWVSYHVATNEDLTSLQEDTYQDTVVPIQDEFDIFEENNDEFDEDKSLNEDLSLEQNFSDDDLLNDLSDTELSDELPQNNQEDLSVDFSIDEPEKDAAVDDLTLNEQNDFITDQIPDEMLVQENISDTSAEFNENNISDENSDISTSDIPASDETLSNIDTSLDLTENSDLSLDETLELTDLTDELNPDGELQDLSENTNNEDSTVEKIHLSEFNELPFDTADNQLDEEPLDELDNLILDNTSIDDIAIPEDEDSTSGELTNFENLGERDDMQPQEDTHFEDDEIASLENIEQVAVEQNVPEESDPQQIAAATFDELELPENNAIESTEEEAVQTLSIDELENSAQELKEIDSADEVEPAPVTLEELSTNIPETPAEEPQVNEQMNNNVEFLESLAEETITEETPNTEVDAEKPGVYENSTVISNQIDAPGEFPIDINQPVAQEGNDDLEKLEILYNNNFEDDKNALQFKTTMPEKGKKAIAVASIAIVALASLLIYASMHKSGNEIAEQNNTSVLEKNLPKLDEQELPQDDTILPAKTTSKPKLEDTANTAAKNINKPKAPVIEEPYLDVKKLSWSVPDYVSYNDDFRKYLQTAGKSLKLSLSSDLLLATEYAYSDQIQVNIELSKEGSIQNANILQSSGSTQIDEIVLRTVNDTLKVVKAPAGVIVGDNIQLILKIYL